MNQRNLPEPEASLAADSQLLEQIILQEIRNRGGAISFSDYMSFALYTPKLGYYSGVAEKFGKFGDFVTAPEISPLFSRCVANFCQESLRNLNGGDILEIGAGSGQMAADILIELYRRNCLPNCYYIFEISPELRKKQQEKILKTLRSSLQIGYPNPSQVAETQIAEQLLSRVQWLNPSRPFNLPKLSDCLLKNSFRGVILANEVLDALPAHRFTLKGGHLYLNTVIEIEGRLGLKEEALCFCHNHSTHDHPIKRNHSFEENDANDMAELLEYFKQTSEVNGINIEDSSFVYHSEINLNIKNWIADLANILQSGTLLCIDYGFPRHEYYHPDRDTGTLMCHYRHRNHPNPFFYPGLQDITTHVDFTYVAQAAELANLEIEGYTNQASFLIDIGLLEFLKQAESDVSDHINTIKQNQAVHILTSPAEMGELFKVMALSKNYEGKVPGFNLNDMRNRL